MVSPLIFLQSFAYFEGGAIGNVLNQWQQAGIFTYAIPFLLIFALVFGILARLNLFGENKSINAILALAVGLMALQFPTVPRFFSQIFPALGVGLAVMLVVLVLTGLFMNDPKNKGWMNFLAVASIVVVVGVLFSSTWGVGYGFWGSFRYFNWLNILGIGLLIGAIVWILSVGSKSKAKLYTDDSPLARALKGE